MKKLVLFFLFLQCYDVIGQLNAPTTQKALDSLSDTLKIDYINTNFYAIYSNDFNNSLRLTELAIKLSRQMGLPAREALALKNHGIILYLTGDYEKSLSAYYKSYDLYESIDDRSGLAQLSNEMANYFQKQGEFERAIELWNQAEIFAKETNDLRTLGTTYGMLASFYWVRKRYEKSDSLYLKCHNIRLLQSDSVGLGYTFLDLADIARRSGHYEEAIDNFNHSIQIREKINDLQGVLESYKALADFYYNENNLPLASVYYSKTIEGSEKMGYPDLQRKVLDSLSSIFYKTGDYKKAIQFKVKAENLEDSLFNLEKSRIISSLQTQYETEKKEQKIAYQELEIAEQQAQIQRNSILLLFSIIAILFIVALALLQRSRLRKKQQLKLQEAQLQTREAEINATISSQEQERARYARDLHDGFGQMISILNMNIGSLKKDAKPNERQQVFEQSEKVINEMYDELKGICFDLMPQTLVKNGLKSGLEEFAERINISGKIFIETNFFGLDTRLSEIQEISLYRISQEWVNNILKYSDADKITLQITKDEEEITLLIEDNGQGFDKSLLQNSKGNGWKNLNTRSNLIQGSLELETQAGQKGSTLIVNAPAKIPEKVSQNTLHTV